MKKSNKMFFILVFLSLLCNISSGTRFKPSRSMKASGGSIISKFLPQLSRNSASGSSRPCTSPSPVSIAPCECSEDYLYGRQLVCVFEFDQSEDVTEMTHNLFKNFNASNNQFDLANFQFSNDGEPSNFMFDDATSGQLEVKVFAVEDIYVENGILPMTESAILGSINSLEALWIVNEDSSNLVFSENFLFAMGQLEVKLLGLLGFDWNKFQIPQETFNKLDSFITTTTNLKFEELPEMPNLKKLSLYPTDETSLTSEILKKMPNLKYLYIDEVFGGKIEPLLPGVFEGSRFLEYIYLYFTNITSIDLTGLEPSTYVVLGRYSINLPEQNFRHFLEGAVRNYISVYGFKRISGGINLEGYPLECSCDFKWLCEVPYATSILYEAECADGTTLESAMEVICNQC